MKNYDYVIVGTGLYGAVFAHECLKRGKRVLMIEKRPHIGGNVYTERIHDIDVHKYGAHIFHTNDKVIWKYVTDLVEFNRFTNSPLARVGDELFSLPFNMNTFYQLWGTRTPAEAKTRLKSEIAKTFVRKPQNLEEQARNLVGDEIYQKFIKGYTEKQWGRPCTELPAFIIKRIPVRFSYDNNYFNDSYQGIPKNGYSALIDRLVEGADILLNTDFLDDKELFSSKGQKLIYTGPIDEYFNFAFGALDYRSLTFENIEKIDEDFQGNAVVNYNDLEVPYTRIIEHKYFNYNGQKNTIITKEFPKEYSEGDERYYPVNDAKNNEIYLKYKELAKGEKNVLFGGRLAEYKYYDMHQVIASSLKSIKNEFHES